MPNSPYAVFNVNDHAVATGWATYHADTPAHEHIPVSPPSPTNGYSPSNYLRCACGAWFKWFAVGQHRYGSIGGSANAE
jgi:hypothetical protein